MPARIRTLTAVVALTIGAAMAGCSSLGEDGTTTASIPQQPAVDPACTALTQEINTMRSEGVPSKADAAAQKKQQLSKADTARVAQYIKANEQFTVKGCPKGALVTIAPAGTPTETKAKAPAKPAAKPTAEAPAKAKVASVTPAPKPLTQPPTNVAAVETPSEDGAPKAKPVVPRIKAKVEEKVADGHKSD